LAFDVSMDYIVSMHILDSQHDLFEQVLRLFFIDPGFLSYVFVKFSSFTIFSDQHKVPFRNAEEVVYFDDVFMVEYFEIVGFLEYIEHILKIIINFHFDILKSIKLTINYISRQVDFTKTTFTQQF